MARPSRKASSSSILVKERSSTTPVTASMSRKASPSASPYARQGGPGNLASARRRRTTASRLDMDTHPNPSRHERNRSRQRTRCSRFKYAVVAPSETRDTFRLTWPLTTTPGSSRKLRALVRPRLASHSERSGCIAHQLRLAASARIVNRTALAGTASPPHREPREQILRGREDLSHGQLAHAPVVERADPQLARPARDLALQVDPGRAISLTPLDERGAEQGDDRPLECG